MSQWSATTARWMCDRLCRWSDLSSKQQRSHIAFSPGLGSQTSGSFPDHEEVGPRMLARIAKRTGLTPDNL